MSDLINRQEVIELVKDSYYNLAESTDDMWAMVADVEKLPSVQQWIPISERLPEEGKDVLIQMTNSMIVGFWETAMDTVAWYANSDDEYYTDIEYLAGYHEPIAWMPLPQPYKEENHE